MHKTRSGDLRLKSGKSLGRIFFMLNFLSISTNWPVAGGEDKRENLSGVCVCALEISALQGSAWAALLSERASERGGRESLQGIKWNNWCARPTRAACSVGGPHGAQKGPCFWSLRPRRPETFPTGHFQCKQSAESASRRQKWCPLGLFGAFARAVRHKEEQIVNREEHFSLTHLSLSLSLYFLRRRFHRFSFTSGIRDEIKTGAPHADLWEKA